MTYAFDTLGYAKRLRDAGIKSSDAEAHAEAARDFVMAELVTKSDLNTALAAVKSEFAAVNARIDKQTLQLTVTMGGIMLAGVTALSLLNKLT